MGNLRSKNRVEFDDYDDEEDASKKKASGDGDATRAARILATIEHLDSIRVASEELLRREERKDSIYELDMSVQRNVEGFRESVLNKLEEQFMVNGRILRTKDAKAAIKEHAALFRKAVCTSEELMRLQAAVLAMETYQRLNEKLKEELETVEKQRERRKEKFERLKAQLKNDLDEAERGFWCRAN